jgi:sarcosine oxidase subunit beta
MLLGSTREFVGFSKGITLEGIHHIAKYVFGILPCLKKLQLIRMFSGLRPYTPDGLPILGKVSGLDGFIMAAGHEGDGIALAPITGEVIAGLITDNPTTSPLNEYNLERFLHENRR